MEYNAGNRNLLQGDTGYNRRLIEADHSGDEVVCVVACMTGGDVRGLPSGSVTTDPSEWQ